VSPRSLHPEGCLCVTCLRDERPPLAALDAIVAPAAPTASTAAVLTLVPPPAERCSGCRRVLLLGATGGTIPCEYCAPRDNDPVERALTLGERMAAAGEAFMAARRTFDAAVAALTPDENLELLRRQVARLLLQEVPRG